MRCRRSIAIFFLAGISVVLLLRYGDLTTTALRGSLLTDREIQADLKRRADTDGDQLLSVREIRILLVAIIRHVIGDDPRGDIDGDSVVSRSDIGAALRGLRALMAAVAGNGLVEAGEDCDDGNLTPADGCSPQSRIDPGFTCTGEPSQCVASGGGGAALLEIAMTPLPSSDTGVPNRQDMTVLRFTASAQSEALQLQRFNVRVTEGNLDGLAFVLWRDTNGDGTVDTTSGTATIYVNQATGIVTIDPTPAHRTIPAGDSVVYEVRVLISPQAVPEGPRRFSFAVDQPDYIVAAKAADAARLAGIRTDGSCTSACSITVATAPTTRWNFVPQGSLDVTGLPVPPLTLPNDTLTGPALRFRLTARHEPLSLNHLIVRINDPQASPLGQRSIGLLLINDASDGNIVAVGSLFSGCGTAAFDAYCAVVLSPGVTIAADEVRDFEVFLQVTAPHDGSQDGDQVIASLTPDAAVPAIEAVGITSGRWVILSDGDGVDEGELFLSATPAEPNRAISGPVHTVSAPVAP